MAETVAPGTPATAKSLSARVIGVVFSPRATYADVAARPRVLGVMAVVIGVLVVATYAFLSTEVGRTAALENQVQQMQAFGRTVSDADYQRMESMAGYSKYFAAVAQLITLPLMALIVSGIAFAVFNAVMGGDATFKHVYAIVAHSGVILIVQTLFGLPIAYAREAMSSAANLAVFFPFLEENTFIARMLGSIDLFVVWWIVSLSIGLGVLYRRRTGPIATTILLLYVVIGLAIAAVKTAMSGA